MLIADPSDVLLNDSEMARLVARMAKLGEIRTAETLRLSRMTLLRLLARQPVRLGSIAMARISLAKAV